MTRRRASRRTTPARPPSARHAGLLLVALLAGCAVGVPDRPEAAGGRNAGDAAAGHVAVIDAGSSGSRLHLYRWGSGGEGAPRVEPLRDEAGAPWGAEVRPGLHAFAAEPELAAARLRSLVDRAVNALGGPGQAAATPLWVLATEGVRGLSEADRRRLLDAVGRALADGPLDFRAARTLSGEEEAADGWIAVNLAAGTLSVPRPGEPPAPTLGALDLGGASTQVTFERAGPRGAETGRPLSGLSVIGLGRPHGLFTRSFAGLGQDRARETIGSADCFAPGYPLSAERVGRGDWQACRQAIREHLASVLPSDPEDPDLLPGVPPLEGELVGLSVYRYTAAFFGLGPRLVPAQLEARGREHCATPWLELQAVRGDDPYLDTRCFAAAYVVTLLTDGYGLAPDDDRVRVDGEDPGWALGAAALALTGLAAPPP